MTKLFKGKKTYIIAIVMVGVSLLKAFGLIDTTIYEAVMGLLAGLGFGTLRAGVEKIIQDCQSGSE